MNTLKQCLHYDPDSKQCLVLHRMLKSFDRGFNLMDELVAKEDWRGVVKLLLAPGGGKNGELWRRWEEAMQENVGVPEAVLPLVPPSLYGETGKSNKLPPITLPNAAKHSPPRQILVRTLCKSYTHLVDAAPSSEEYKKQTAHWCDELLSLEGCAEDVDGLVGHAEGLLVQEEWEQAVRVLEKAFEVSGRSDRAVSI